MKSATDSQQHKSGIIIAVDGMGGDNAPNCVIKGLGIALQKYSDLNFIIYGDEQKLTHLLKKNPKVAKVSRVIHTDEAILNEDKPSVALRQKKKSSMALSIRAVANGEAHAVVSSGNTGALMALAKIILRTLPGIDRPAICSLLPTKSGECVMLDLGANVVCDANNLFEFAVMGDAFARSLLGIESPVIGLLNIGTEELKGNEVVKEAATLLKENELELNFYGHIEGTDIGNGKIDVVVTDGFSGNIALKTAEGTAKMMYSYMKEQITNSLLAKIGVLLAKGALIKVKNKFDPRMYNGAMILGLNGIVVKSHGSSDAEGFANAVRAAAKLAIHGINENIMREMIESGHVTEEEATKENLSTVGGND